MSHPDEPPLDPADEEAYRDEQADYDGHLPDDEPQDDQEGEDR
ncbi:hypothetical protein AB0J28_00390 [Streptosporangium canum]